MREYVAAERVTAMEAAAFAPAIAAELVATFATTVVAAISIEVQALINKGALSNARSISSEGVLVTKEGEQVVVWSNLANARDAKTVRAHTHDRHDVRRDGENEDQAVRIRNGYYEAVRAHEAVRTVPARDRGFNAIHIPGGSEKVARARGDDHSSMHARDGVIKASVRVRAG